MCVCICGYGHMSAGLHWGQKKLSHPGICRYRQLWAARQWWWEPNSTLPLQEQCVLQKTEPSLQPKKYNLWCSSFLLSTLLFSIHNIPLIPSDIYDYITIYIIYIICSFSSSSPSKRYRAFFLTVHFSKPMFILPLSFWSLCTTAQRERREGGREGGEEGDGEGRSQAGHKWNVTESNSAEF